MTVTRHYLRLQRLSLIIWAFVLVFLTAVTASSAGAVTQGNALQELIGTLPPALQRIIGAHIANPVDAFVAIKLLFIIPPLCGIVGALAASAIVQRDRDKRTVDFLLSLPVGRARVVRERFAAVIAGLALLYFIVWLSLAVVLRVSGLESSLGRYAIILLAGLAINVAQAGLALALSLQLPSYDRVVRYSLGLVLISYALELALKSADAAPTLRYFLLYRLADPVELMMDPGGMWPAILVGAAIAFFALRWSQERFMRTDMEV
jgi:ABC-2 type transport system permease protein